MRSFEHVLLSSALVAMGRSGGMYLPSSCVEQQDGSTWLKLMEDTPGTTYPAVRQKCHNEFMVIDPNEDPNVVEYFTSYTSWHYAISGPDMMDFGNWENWWRPSAQFLGQDIGADNDEYFQFAISPDCSSCDLDNNVNDLSLFSDDNSTERTAYYMTGTLFGCLAKHKALKDCRWDYASYTCGYCTQDDTTADLDYTVVFPEDELFTHWVDYYNDLEDQNWNDLQLSLCGVAPYSSATDKVPETRTECSTFQDNIKPSIGNNGQFCVCAKPHESYTKELHSVTDEEFEDYEKAYWEYHAEPAEDTASITDVHELYQSDFANGTYRISSAGTYKIMEDITFDFNAGDLEHPNEGTMQWWPISDQVDEYEGAGQTRDNYYLGFIAGITVEVDDVIIDLNGFTVAMSEALYYQQRFFSCIALKSVAFPLNQGPGFFGMEPKYANNVVIKNGNIGLSSHHGIHGHYNKDVVIEDVHIYDFETHGVQMSYFENLKMKNVEIGPSSTKAYLKGEYAYARWTVQALERIQEAGGYNDIFPLKFDGRDETMEFDDVIIELRHLMDIAFKSVMGIENYADHDPEYRKAKDLFINEDGLPYGAVMYGLFLNLWFANVFTIHPSTKHASGADIENLKIHGLHHKTMEYQRLDDPVSAMFRNQFNAPLDANALLGTQINPGSDEIMMSRVTYQGSALSDAFIVLAMVTDDWEELALTYMENNFTDWAQGTFSFSDARMSSPKIGCNVDRMGHVPKGIIGIRMDGVENVVFNGLTITDLHEQSKRGSDLCGEYWDETFTNFMGMGNTLQNAPYLYGYTGNRAHGIFGDWSEYTFAGHVQISDLVCDTGLVRGVGMYRESTVTFAKGSTLEVSGLSAGHELYTEDTSAYAHPYNPSEAKPFHIQWVNDVNQTVMGETVTKVFNSSMTGHPEMVSFSCVYGRDGVDTSDWIIEADNTDCGEFGDLMDEKADSLAATQSRWMKAERKGFNLKTVALMVSVMIFILAAGWILNSGSEERSKMSMAAETAPLLRA